MRSPCWCVTSTPIPGSACSAPRPTPSPMRPRWTSHPDLDELPAWAADCRRTTGASSDSTWRRCSAWPCDELRNSAPMSASRLACSRRRLLAARTPHRARGLLRDDAFIHHWQQSAFRLLGESTYRRIFEENRQRFVDKWGSSAPSHGSPSAQRSLPPHDLLRRAAEAPGPVVSPRLGIHLLQRPHHLARVLAQRGYLVVFHARTPRRRQRMLRRSRKPNLFSFRRPPYAPRLAGASALVVPLQLPSLCRLSRRRRFP